MSKDEDDDDLTWGERFVAIAFILSAFFGWKYFTSESEGEQPSATATPAQFITPPTGDAPSPAKREVAPQSDSFAVSGADNLGDLPGHAKDVGVGSKISCNWKGLGTFYPGTVTSRDGDNISVKYDDGDFERTTIQCIKVTGMPKREELKPKKAKSTRVRADYEICSNVISGSRNFFDQISVSIGVSSKNIEIVGGVYGGAGDRCKVNVMTPLGPMNCNSGPIYTDNGGRSYYTRGTEIGVNNSCSKI